MSLIESIYFKVIAFTSQTQDIRISVAAAAKSAALANIAIFFSRYLKDIYKTTQSYQATSGKWEERLLAYVSQPIADILKLVTTEVIEHGGIKAITTPMIIVAHALMTAACIAVSAIIFDSNSVATIKSILNVHLLLFGSLIATLGFYKLRQQSVYSIQEGNAIYNITTYPIFIACALAIPASISFTTSVADITAMSWSLSWSKYLMLFPGMAIYFIATSLASSTFASGNENSSSLSHDSSSSALLHDLTYNGHVLLHRILFIFIFIGGAKPIGIVQRILNKPSGTIWIAIKLFAIYAIDELRQKRGFSTSIRANEMLAYCVGPSVAIWCTLVQIVFG